MARRSPSYLAARLEEDREDIAALDGNPPTALSPDTIALAALSLGRGLTLEMLVDPDSVSDETVGRIVAELLP